MKLLSIIKPVLTFFLFIIFTNINIFPNNIKIIKNPKPNILEKNYGELKKIKEIGADLGKGEYLFKPISLTIDKDGNLYAYDVLQSKILIFNSHFEFIKSLGREGQGPGEFINAGKLNSVFIKFGRDGNLYCNDVIAKKIITFNQKGDYIQDYKYKRLGTSYPIVDALGNIYFLSVKDFIVRIKNQNQIYLFKLENEKRNFDYLFFKPSSLFLFNELRNLSETLFVDLTINSILLIYFPNSSTMLILKDQKILRKMRIWPKESLSYFKPEIENIIKKDDNRYKSLFFKLIVDEDDANIFYLQFLGRKGNERINALYKFDLQGKLIKVLYIKSKKTYNAHFELIKNGHFYSIANEKINIYKEN